MKYNLKLSNEFLEKIVVLLDKNSIINLQDLIMLLKNSEYRTKLIKNDNLPLVDELKFKHILEKEFNIN